MGNLKQYFFPLLLVVAWGFAPEVVSAQDSTVKVVFEKDGKQTSKRFSVRIYLDKDSYYATPWPSKGIKPKVEHGAFTVPSEVMKHEKIAFVFFEIGGYALTFPNVPVSAFETAEWVVGVDTRPFEKENVMRSLREKDIDYASYLKFTDKAGKLVKILVN